MLFAVLFEDETSKAEARQRLMPEHLAFLGKNAAMVRAAGPLSEPGSGAGAGGMWLVEAESEAEVRKLYESDPFWPTGLRRSVRVLAWKQVFKA